MELVPAQPADARAILTIHHNAVRGLAANDYEAHIVAEWASMPITGESVERYIRVSMAEETTVVAKVDSQVVGFASIVEKQQELRAVYVDPSFARKGVGSALLRAVEDIARQRGIPELRLDSSLNAEPFYQVHGYTIVEKGEHTLKSGQRMACIKMRKTLA